MATKEDRDRLHAELVAIEAERATKHADLDAKRTAYHEALAVAQEVSDRENAKEDEYEAAVVETEPPGRPTE